MKEIINILVTELIRNDWDGAVPVHKQIFSGFRYLSRIMVDLRSYSIRLTGLCLITVILAQPYSSYLHRYKNYLSFTI